MQLSQFTIFAGAICALAACLGLASSHQSARSTGDALPDYTKIEVETAVAAPLVDAWKCWSTTEGARSFFAPHAEIEPHPGGPFEIWFNPGGAPGERGAEGLKVLSV